MENYDNLVAALRCKRDDCEGCDLAFFDKDEGWMCQFAAKDDDAADAIEALQAELLKAEMRCADCEYGNKPWPEEPGQPKRGEIVRCGECKWWREYTTNGKHDGYGICDIHYFADRISANSYCSDGEKMEVQE